MKYASPLFIAFAVLCTADIALAAAVGSPDEEYRARVNQVLFPALLPQFDKIHIISMITFSFTLDRCGRQELLGVGSAPKNRAAEEVAIKVIRSLKFPAPSKRVIGNYDLIKFNIEVTPKRK
jgi:hypothetical protein